MTSMIVTPSNKQEFILLEEMFKKMRIEYKPLAENIDDKTDSEDLYRFSMMNFSRAYSDEEPEYTSDMIKEPNPGYNHSLSFLSSNHNIH